MKYLIFLLLMFYCPFFLFGQDVLTDSMYVDMMESKYVRYVKTLSFADEREFKKFALADGSCCLPQDDPIQKKIDRYWAKPSNKRLPAPNTIIPGPARRYFLGYEDGEAGSYFLDFYSSTGNFVRRVKIQGGPYIKYSTNGNYISVNNKSIFDKKGRLIYEFDDLHKIKGVETECDYHAELMPAPDGEHFLFTCGTTAYYCSTTAGAIWSTNQAEGTPMFSHDGNYFIVPYRGSLNVFNTKNGKLLSMLTEYTYAVFSVNGNIYFSINDNRFFHFKIN